MRANFKNFLFSVAVGCPTIVISPASTLPAGLTTNFYNSSLTSSGGLSPYTYGLVDGALPNGFSLSTGGYVSGTPTGATSALFIIASTGKLELILGVDLVFIFHEQIQTVAKALLSWVWTLIARLSLWARSLARIWWTDLTIVPLRLRAAAVLTLSLLVIFSTRDLSRIRLSLLVCPSTLKPVALPALLPPLASTNL